MSTPPTSYQVQGRSVHGGGAVIHAGDQRIPIDASWAAEEPSGLPGPAELLASAFAACLLKNVERASALLSFEYESVEVDVHARRQDDPPKFIGIEYEVRVVTAEEQRRVELLHVNLSKYGTVYNTLAAACEVHGRVTAVPRATPDESEKPARATRTVVVGSRLGLHADAAIHFVEAARATGHDVSITNVDGEVGDADSLISVLETPVGPGQEVTLEVEGANANRVADELAKLLASHLDSD